jgi:hypothetical protein
VSAEVSEEVVVEEQVDPAVLQIRKERKLAEAVRDYLEKMEQFEKASTGLNESCQALRGVVEPNTSVVVGGGYGKLHGKYFLLVVNSDGNFRVDPVEVI